MSHEEPEQTTAPVERKVIIEVLGGVAYAASRPDDVEVEVKDFDNLKRMERDERI